MSRFFELERMMVLVLVLFRAEAAPCMRVDEVLEVLDTYRECDRYTALVVLVCLNVTSLKREGYRARGTK